MDIIREMPQIDPDVLDIVIGIQDTSSFPDLRLDPGHEVELHGFEFRGPKAVHVLS